MKKIRHSKFKNTGILFELLARQLTTDVLDEQDNSIAAKLVREFFNGTTELSKELGLYKTLLKEKFSNENKAKDLVTAVLDARKKLSNSKLKREKYMLVREINNKFLTNNFFVNKLDDYRIFASIYKLFEEITTSNKLEPTDAVKSRYTLIEHIMSKQKKMVHDQCQNQLLNEFRKQEKDLRLLTYKILLERFNERYGLLDNNQKILLREYITNISNTPKLRKFVDVEIKKVSNRLITLIPSINDQITKIKLTEVIKNIPNLTWGKTVKDEQVVSLLRYYELIKELEKIEE